MPFLLSTSLLVALSATPQKAVSQYVTVNQVKYHYTSTGDGQPVVLLHGWPQNLNEWNHVVPTLAKKYRVIAIDMKGSGKSDKPTNSGYDKKTIAQEVRGVVKQLGLSKVHLVGHDIGMMVAYAYAAQFPSEVSKLVVMDAPLPGTNEFTQISQDPRAWHFAFQAANEVPEHLVKGRERWYFKHFMLSVAGRPNVFTEREFDEYAKAQSQPGALTGGFNYYRAFAQDAKDNAEWMKTPLTMPVLALNGGVLTNGYPFVLEMMKRVATNVQGEALPNTGHWIPEEQPALLTEKLLRFLG
jgi:pimeloyl-ACP methyl ester carboxylesterase